MFANAGLEDQIILPQLASYDVRHIYNQFCIRVKDGKRDALKQFLLDNGVGCAVYYPLSLHLQDCFKELGGKLGDHPVSENASGEIMALPVFGELEPAQLEYVVATIAKFYGK